MSIGLNFAAEKEGFNLNFQIPLEVSMTSCSNHSESRFSPKRTQG
jgi:hypothetical protein